MKPIVRDILIAAAFPAAVSILRFWVTQLLAWLPTDYAYEIQLSEKNQLTERFF